MRLPLHPHSSITFLDCTFLLLHLTPDINISDSSAHSRNTHTLILTALEPFKPDENTTQSLRCHTAVEVTAAVAEAAAVDTVAAAAADTPTGTIIMEDTMPALGRATMIAPLIHLGKPEIKARL